jgi:hypothetical protein
MFMVFWLRIVFSAFLLVGIIDNNRRGRLLPCHKVSNMVEARVNDNLIFSGGYSEGMGSITREFFPMLFSGVHFKKVSVMIIRSCGGILLIIKGATCLDLPHRCRFLEGLTQGLCS